MRRARPVVLAAAVVAAALATPTPVAAQPSTVPPSATPPTGAPAAPARVHRGLYLRADLGLALPSFTADRGGSTITIKGRGVGFGLAVGHSVRDNLIIHLAVFEHQGDTPTVVRDGDENTLDTGSLQLVGLGIGATYYVMPLDLSLSATLSGSRMHLREAVNGAPLDLVSTDSGGGLSLTVGKEWRVARGAGLGVAAHLFIGAMTDEGYDPASSDDLRWSGRSLALLCSASYD